MKHNNTKTCPDTLLELVNYINDPLGGYKHLQIIQNRKNDSIRLGFGQEYLVVTPNGFGVYRLDDIDYISGVILMTMTNITTCNMTQINLDISDEHPKFFLVNWCDIKNMVYTGRFCNNINGDLLELENDKST